MSIIQGYMLKNVATYGKGTIELPDGEIFVCGSTSFTILDRDMFKRIPDTEWAAGAGNSIASVLKLSGETLLLVGSNGHWAIIDYNGNRIRNGLWSHGAIIINHSIKTIDGNVLMVGYSGRWELFDKNLISIKSGTWPVGSSSIFDAIVLNNGDIFTVGSSGNCVHFDKNMNFKRNYTWSHGSSYTITNVVLLDDGNVVCAGNSHYSVIKITDNGITNVNSTTWAFGTGQSIGDMKVLPTGDVLMVGGGGTVVVVSKNTYMYKLYTNTTWYYTASSIRTALPLSNGKIFLAGDNGRYMICNLFNILTTPALTLFSYFSNTSPTTTIGYYSSNGIVEFDDGEILMVGDSGQMSLVYSTMRTVTSLGTWAFGSTVINTAVKLNNGDVLLLGPTGRWQIMTNNAKTNVSYSNNLLSTNTIYTAIVLPNNNVIVGGNSGRWELTTDSMNILKSGIWSAGETKSIRVSLRLLNGDILLAGLGGEWNLFDSEMNSKKSGRFLTGSNNFYSGRVLRNGNIALGADSSFIALYTPDMELIRYLNAGNSSAPLSTIDQLDNDDLLVTYSSSDWKIVSPDLLTIHSSGAWEHSTTYQIYTSKLLSNNHIIWAGGQGRFQISPPEYFMSPSNVSKINTTFSKLKNKSIVELPSGRLVTFDSTGKWYVIDNDMSILKSSSWVYGQTMINTMLLIKNKFILLAGNEGKWELYDINMTSIKSGTWNSGSLNILSSLYISSKGIVLGGQSSKYELFDISMNHISTHNMGWGVGADITDIYHHYPSSPEEILFSSNTGKITRVYNDLISHAGTVTWIMGTVSILSHTVLYDDTIITIGDKYRTKNNIGMTANQGTGSWGWGDVGKINTVSQLTNSRLFLGGDQGKYEIISHLLASYKKGSIKEFQHTNIASSIVKYNGDIVIIGEDGTLALIRMGNLRLSVSDFNISSDSVKNNEVQTLTWDATKINKKIYGLMIDIYDGEKLYSRKKILLGESMVNDTITMSDEENKNNIEFRYSIRAIMEYNNSYYMTNPIDLPEFLLVFFTALENVSLPQPNNIFAKENIDTLRTKANEFRVSNGLSPYVWTDSTIVKKSTPVKAIHMNEIQNAITEVYTQSNTPIIDEIKPVVEQEVKPKNHNFPIKEFGNRLYNIIRALKNQ